MQAKDHPDHSNKFLTEECVKMSVIIYSRSRLQSPLKGILQNYANIIHVKKYYLTCLIPNWNVFDFILYSSGPYNQSHKYMKHLITSQH